MPHVQVNGTRIHYTVEGSGPPAMLVHGLGSSHRDWEFNAPALSKSHTLVIPDCRGHGLSGKAPGRYSIDLFASDLAELVETLDLEPIHLLGISMGGMIAMRLAADRPKMVRSLTVVNAGCRIRIDSLRARLSLVLRRFLLNFIGMRAVGKKLGQEMFPERGQEKFRRLVEQRWAENDRGCYRRSLDAVLGFDMCGQLERIKCPALFVRGELDDTPVELPEQYIRSMPDARLVVIEGSRHATPIDRAEEFNTLVERFWSEVESNGNQRPVTKDT
ncbi:MAG: alpha/beta hydrolase [Deltaproteobacteria bacterium]|nr:MAG: alpha/beta hydrolase [Deltaproteobacteria bacterium]